MNKKSPNVILVITDDQGYGDLGCGGNKNIHTPNIDKFSKESCNLDDFHVAPLCAPTRGELMSGCCALRNGVWATCWGRSIMSLKHKSMAESFSEAGYATGMFGKWHLGDNYPYRPQDRGFQRVVAHKGGGVGQTPDFWGNNYFDDTYFKNGVPTSFDGYCTDVWFEQAKSFISDNKDKPFFAYIATNAPHSPYLVDEKYSEHYRDNDDIVSPEFYGMIENIDENFGDLRKTLIKLNIEDNTILIFMTDNGSSGCGEFDDDENLTRGFNSNMRGMKGSFYEGGHRVPFIINWANGNLNVEKHIKDAIYGVDIYPTLSQICNLNTPSDIDGISFSDCLLSNKKRDKGRIQVIQYEQDTNTPDKNNVTLSKDNYRLIKCKELYDIEKDPSQKNDISDEHKDLVKELLSFYDNWWDNNIESAKKYVPIYLGDDGENPCRLDAMDVLGDVAWNQMQVLKAVRSSGIWSVSIRKTGNYKFTLKRWPIEEKELRGTPIAPYVPWQKQLEMANIKTGHLEIDNIKSAVEWNKEKEECEFKLNVEKNDYTTLKAGFTLEDGEYCGAYYVYVERLN
jgi:arylsulfatase A-like enzyme